MSESTPLNAAALSESQSALAKLFNTLFNVTAFNTTGDILTNLHNVLSNIVWYRIMSWFYFGISIASLCIGAIYLHLCTVEHMIPVYLIVAGTIGLCTNLLFMTKWATGAWAPWTSCRDTNDSCRSFWFSWTLWLLFLFNFAWFIAGSVWIFGTYNRYHENWDYEPDTHLYVVRHMHSRHYALHQAAKVAHAQRTAHFHMDGSDTILSHKLHRDMMDDAEGNHEHDSDSGERHHDFAESKHDISRSGVSDEHKLSVDKLEDDDDGAGAGAADEEAARDASLQEFNSNGINFGAAHRVRKYGGMPRHPYCHRGLFEYSFWITIVAYILFALDLLIFLTLTCCNCCAFMVVPYTNNAVPG